MPVHDMRLASFRFDKLCLWRNELCLSRSKYIFIKFKSLNLFCQNGLCILLKNFVHGYFNNNCLKITCLLDSIISLWGCELILHLGIWLSCSGNNFKTDKDLFSLKSYLNYNNRIKTPQSVKSSFTHLFNVELPHFIFLGVCVAETSLCKTGNSWCLNL